MTFSNVDFCNSYHARICLPCLTSIASNLVLRVLSRRLVPVGLLLGAISLIFSSITGVERRERTGERSSTDVPRIAISPNSARTSVSTPGVVARLQLLSITISLSSESMNIGVDDEVADIWLPEAVVWLCWLC